MAAAALDAAAEASPPESRVSRLFGRCKRRRVRSQSQLMVFVTQEDLRRMAFPGLRTEEEAADAFSRWHGGVAPWRRGGTAEDPSVSVDIEGVELPERGY